MRCKYTSKTLKTAELSCDQHHMTATKMAQDSDINSGGHLCHVPV